MTRHSVATSGEGDYSVFGLRVQSELELPELFPAIGSEPADVTVEFGKVEEAIGGEGGLSKVDGGLVLAVPDVGRYKISRGRRITIDPAPNVPERNLRLFLLGSAFG